MNVLEELHGAGAVLLDRHFVYSSGMHGPDYIHIDALLTNRDLLSRICGELVLPFADEGIEAVTACITDRCSMLASLAAEHLGVEPAYQEELRGKRTLIAEDVLTSGQGVIDIRREAESFGGQVVGAGVIANRGAVTARRLGVPRLETLVDVSLDAFEPEDCGLCADGRPIAADVGKGSNYQQTHPGYTGGYELILLPS